MEPIYQQEITLTENHVDRYGRAKPSILLYFMQEAAGQHCHLLAADHDTLSQKHLFWAVTRSRVQVTRLPRLGERITLKTWPMPTTRVAYPRAVAAYDAEGTELFRAISLWVLMDSRTRAMVLPGKSGVEVAGSLTGTELSAPRAIPVQAMEHTAERTVGYTLLDRNGHMNNTYYLDWVDDLLPSSFHENHPVREFTVCYLNEARENDRIHLGYTLSEEAVLTVDATRNGERIFSAQVLF